MKLDIITDDYRYFVNVDEKKWPSTKGQLLNNHNDFVDFGEIILRKDIIIKKMMYGLCIIGGACLSVLMMCCLIVGDDD